MNWITALLIGAGVLFILLGVVGYLLIIANGQANQTEARVRAILRQARMGDDAPGALR
jgi:hypothetical protein